MYGDRAAKHNATLHRCSTALSQVSKHQTLGVAFSPQRHAAGGRGGCGGGWIFGTRAALGAKKKKSLSFRRSTCHNEGGIYLVLSGGKCYY